jgi:hypothetical protein
MGFVSKLIKILHFPNYNDDSMTTVLQFYGSLQSVSEIGDILYKFSMETERLFQ